MASRTLQTTREGIEDRGALGSAFILMENGKAALGSNWHWPRAPRHFQCAGGIGCGQRVGHWSVEAQSVFRSLQCAVDAWGNCLRFSNGAALINDSYNSTRRPARDDYGVSGDSHYHVEFLRWGNARTWRDFAAASSRSGQNLRRGRGKIDGSWASRVTRRRLWKARWLPRTPFAIQVFARFAMKLRRSRAKFAHFPSRKNSTLIVGSRPLTP